MPNLKQAIIGTMASLVVFALVALITGSETIVCLIYAVPLLLLAIAIGWSIGRAIQKNRKNKEANFTCSEYSSSETCPFTQGAAHLCI